MKWCYVFCGHTLIVNYIIFVLFYSNHILKISLYENKCMPWIKKLNSCYELLSFYVYFQKAVFHFLFHCTRYFRFYFFKEFFLIIPGFGIGNDKETISMDSKICILFSIYKHKSPKYIQTQHNTVDMLWNFFISYEADSVELIFWLCYISLKISDIEIYILEIKLFSIFKVC